MWLEKADEDVRIVHILLGIPMEPRSAICFHGQQAAEKTLKAFLVYSGQQPRKTHVLEQVLQECIRYEPSLSGLLADCTMLTPFGVAPRYPGLVPDPTAQETTDAVAAMERIRIAVRALLPI